MLSPSNSEVLYHLGDSQLALYDNFTNVHNYSNDIKKNNMHYLEEAERSYRASIRVEGKSLHGNEHSSLISDSLWWKKRHRNSQGSTKLKSEVIPQLKCNEKVSKPIHKVSSVTNKGIMFIFLVFIYLSLPGFLAILTENFSFIIISLWPLE